MARRLRRISEALDNEEPLGNMRLRGILEGRLR
jgi:hypothetical protein